MTQSPLNDISQHVPAIQRIARAMCRGDADADDVAQEVWLAAQEQADRGAEMAPVSWLPWFAGAGRRILWARQRSEGRRRERERLGARTESVPAPEERLMQLEAAAQLLELVRELPPAQCEVVCLRFWDGLPPRAIARRLGVSVEAVKTRQKRALAALRARMSEGNSDENSHGPDDSGGREAWLSALTIPSMAPQVARGGAGLGSLASFGALMTTHKILAVVVLALVAIGIGTAWLVAVAPQEAEIPEAAVEIATVAVTEGEPWLSEVAPPQESDRDPVVTRIAASPAEAVFTAAGPPEGLLVATGRVWNVPVGGDRAKAVPAVNVHVAMHSFGMLGLGEEAIPTATTDDSGAFRLEYAVKREHVLMNVTVPGDYEFAGAGEEVQWKVGQPQPPAIDLYRLAFSALDGEVVDRSGTPIPGARLTLQDGSDSPPETTSDDAGRFRFPHCTTHGYVLAELPGWTTLSSKASAKNEAGEWLPAKVVMCRTGALGIHLHGRDGEPVAGVRIVLEGAPAEAYGVKRPHADWGSFQVIADGTTGADGVAWFRGAWADLNLRMRLFADGILVTVERELEGSLLPEPCGGAGSPIMVSPDRERKLSLKLEALGSLRCLVLDSSGNPFPGASVRLISANYVPWKSQGLFFKGEADEEGCCEIRLVSSRALGPAILTASDTGTHMFRWPEGESPRAATLRVNLDQPPGETVVLTLANTLEISGRLLDPEGAPLKGSVEAQPVDGDLVAGHMLTGFRPSVSASKDGQFCLAGMPDGHFNIVAKCQGYARVVAKGVRAGTQGLQLRMEGPPPARVEVFVDTGGVPMDTYVTLVGRYGSGSAEVKGAPLLLDNQTLDEPFGWPADMQGLWYGGGGNGSSFFSLTPSKEPLKRLELDPGLYWIGAQAKAADGTMFAQMGTGLVSIQPGDHRVRLRMRARVSLSGVVRGDYQGAGLAVALAMDDGRLVPMDAWRESMVTIVDVGARGDFRLDHAPAGTYELRVGTPVELQAGESRASRRVDLIPGKPLLLEVDI
ncbi:RNA polymerase sigma factor [Planctomycetes bacterium Poly30]|uniref:RNA polymerase sigma factor n=2 Tax=Saltatorellus ferox TaxID=2528018 RepID=A0A518EX14_9BACT|nr:RNA polymerase sigma factor [Planctomycetes bacterium Poly30]